MRLLIDLGEIQLKINICIIRTGLRKEVVSKIYKITWRNNKQHTETKSVLFDTKWNMFFTFSSFSRMIFDYTNYRHHHTTLVGAVRMARVVINFVLLATMPML